MNAETKDIRWRGLIVASIITVHLLIAVPLAYFLNIWADEASTLHTTEHGIAFAISHALADEKQAPLYFWTLGLWRELSGSIFFARLFSIVSGAMAIRLFFDVARRFLSERAALFVTLLFALHPFLIWASLEIRVYALVILLSLLLLRLWLAFYFESAEKRIQRRSTLVFLGVAAVALYTNYYLGFLLAGLFAALIATRKWRAAAAYFFNMAAVAVCFAPLIWAVRSQFAANTVAFQTDRSFVTGMQLIWNTFLTFVLPTEIYPLEQITTVSLVRVWFVRIAALVIAAILIRKRREVFDGKFVALAAIAATIGAFFLASYLVLGEVYVAIRHASVLFGPLLLLVSLVLFRILPAKVWPGLLGIYLGLFAYSLTMLYPSVAKRGDWARVGAFLERNERTGQPIVVFTTFDALALPYHYKGVNKILPDEKFYDWELEAPAGTPEAWLRQTEFILSKIPGDAEEIWLLTNEKCDVRESCRPLENFIERNYTIELERSFYLEKIRLLRKKNDRND